MNERGNRIEEIFTEALNLSGPARTAFLDRSCGADAALRGEVESLLAASKPEGFLNDPAIVVEARAVAAQTTNMTLKFPEIDGRYEILGEAGRGGMGVVYRVRDRESGEIVAIKVLHPDLASDPTMIDRLKREVNLSRRVTHRNVCRVHDLHRAGDLHYLSMEFVGGDSLRRALMLSGAFTAKRGVELARQVCEGLREAHRQEIIHRDLKPENIMIDGGVVKLMDFGIARHGWTSGMTRQNSGLLGTPAYMSPEQVNGQPLDVRSDIYSLGLILYELFTGRAPFTADTPYATAFKRLSEIPVSPRMIDAAIPEEIDQLIMRCLEREPQRRYPSVDELLAALPDYGATTVPRHSFATKPSTWQDVPLIQPRIARMLLMLTQAGYLALYIAVLAYWRAALDALDRDWHLSEQVAIPLVMTAVAGIAVRIYLMTTVVWNHPATGSQFRKLFPALLILDVLWAAAPLLLVDRIDIGLAMAATAGLAYLPFAQKTLVLNAFPQALTSSSR